ncbi:efflux transporter outer membrane subunit [Chromobacterium subtsugae]|uniref:Efflux transporter outer membrane subunit n=1 Tax=Chromobacterium subtsugae TaxID=251747 RepID=A0ABS7FHB6_9NEIS|nr:MULTISPECIES: efflux transporter outer membrane subunit [Chromobacterium]KUM03555.1 RND transporter [Chromobacterium subtsugae]KZE88316.1 RND transporter [Chromobacterium sp. F49]MBW7568695.1 efflux transporter outer membrane subunit [Chromobacterium subtsugae]MBW8289475.1 efflux transporter outer membrane subunit [Chromobacterium subtsugae]WSE89984.1 efflux transporter outer membrane subunit [Chromobacterium subtsugae]
MTKTTISIQRALCAALCAAALAGCAVGPDYAKPKLDIPASFKEDGRWKTAEPQDAMPRGDWWSVFHDQTLNGLMDTLNRQSPTIAQAEAQYREAQAQLRQAQAGLFPSLSANAAKTRGVSTPGGGAATAYNLGLSASWEVDLWGAVRREVEAGKAKQQASEAQLAAIRLSSQAQLATAYLQLAVADAQLANLRASEKLLADTLQLTRNQYAAGIVGDDAVASAESQWKTSQAATVDKQLTRAQLEHAIAAQLGQAPASFALPPAAQAPYLPQIPAGLPSTLLERRPDIAAAERNMAAANAQIGIAKAAFFPTLSLGASGGYRGSSFADWVSLPNRIWSVGPSLALTLFDAGLRSAQTDQAVASYDASVASYRQTVLAALQGVEDNLSAQSLLEQEAGMQSAALAAAKRAEAISLNQYQAGTVAYLNVLSAQNTRINAENNLWSVKNRQYASSVALIAALGGSW